MSGRNAEIDFYRLMMTFFVIMVHSRNIGIPDLSSYPFAPGYLAVEFFFLLSGYYAVKKAENAGGEGYKNVLSWTWKKFKGIYLYTIPVGIVHLILFALKENADGSLVVNFLKYGIYEIFLLRMEGFGWSQYYCLGPLWYLSALLVTLPLFYALMIRGKDFFLHVICPLSCIMIYGFFAHVNGNISQAHNWLGLCKDGVLRAWAGLCLGGVAYLIAKGLRGMRPLTRFGKWVITTAQVLLVAVVIYHMRATGRTRMDFLYIACILLFTSIALSERTLIHRLFPAFFSRISEFSLALYVTHWTVLYVFVLAYMENFSWKKQVAAFFILSILYAMLWWLIISLVKRLNIAERLKKIIFAPNEKTAE